MTFQMFSGATKDVIVGVKKAGLSIQSGLGAESKGNAELGIAILNEKSVSEAFTKVASTKPEALESLVKWSEQERNPVMKELFSRLKDVGLMWAKLHQQYSEQYDLHRKSYKEIVKGEHTLERMKKDVDTNSLKVSKLKKQVESSRGRKEHFQLELAKSMSLKEKSDGDLKYCSENHKKYKYLKLQEALNTQNNANFQFYTKGLKIVEAQRQIMQIFFGSNCQHFTPLQAQSASGEASFIINNLADELGLPRPGEEDRANRQSLRYQSSLQMDSSDDDDVPDYMALPQKEIIDAHLLREASQKLVVPNNYQVAPQESHQVASSRGSTGSRSSLEGRELPDLPSSTQAQQQSTTTTFNIYDNSDPQDDTYEYVTPYEINPRLGQAKSVRLPDALPNQHMALSATRSEPPKMVPTRPAPATPVSSVKSPQRSTESVKSADPKIRPPPPTSGPPRTSYAKPSAPPFSESFKQQTPLYPSLSGPDDTEYLPLEDYLPPPPSVMNLPPPPSGDDMLPPPPPEMLNQDQNDNDEDDENEYMALNPNSRIQDQTDTSGGEPHTMASLQMELQQRLITKSTNV